MGLIALAACLTLLFTRPWIDRTDTDAPPVPLTVIVGRLVRATGPIELQLPDQADWQTVSSDSSHSLISGTRIRTGREVLCEVETSDKGVLRLDRSAEMVIQNKTRFSWSRVSCGVRPLLQVRSI